MTPSATAEVRSRLLTRTSTVRRCGSRPRWRMTSFMAWIGLGVGDVDGVEEVDE